MTTHEYNCDCESCVDPAGRTHRFLNGPRDDEDNQPFDPDDEDKDDDEDLWAPPWKEDEDDDDDDYLDRAEEEEDDIRRDLNQQYDYDL